MSNVLPFRRVCALSAQTSAARSSSSPRGLDDASAVDRTRALAGLLEALSSLSEETDALATAVDVAALATPQIAEALRVHVAEAVRIIACAERAARRLGEVTR